MTQQTIKAVEILKTLEEQQSKIIQMDTAGAQDIIMAEVYVFIGEAITALKTF